MKKTTLLIAALLMMPLGGCTENTLRANAREVNEMEIVQTVGIDYAGGRVTVTAATGTSPEGEVTILSSEAETVSQAMREMQNYSTKKYIYFGHSRNLLIGEAAAKNGVSIYLEYVERGIDMRLDTKMYIVKGGTAKAAISEASREGESINECMESLERDVQLLSESYVFSCGDVAEEISEDGCALISAIELIDNEWVILGENSNMMQSVGFALISSGRLEGYIGGDAAKGATILINRAKRGTVEIPDGAGGVASVEMTSAKASVDAVFDGNAMKRIIISVDICGNLAELQNPINIYDASVMKGLEHSLAETELTGMEKTVELMHDLGVDLLKLGNQIESRHPVRYRRLGNADEQVMNAELEINVTARIERTYDLGISPAEKRTEA